MFENGNFPFWYSNCTVEKVWDPVEVEECIRKYNVRIMTFTKVKKKE